jgi:O-antigen/teichoic acid export membrane protein
MTPTPIYPAAVVPSLRRNFAWAFVGSIVLSICQWVVLIALAKLAGDARTGAIRNGDWSIALAVTGPVFVFFLFKLRQVQTTDARDEHTWSTYAALRLLGMAAAVVVTAGVVAVGYRDHTAAIIAGVALSKVFEGGSDLVYGRLQRLERLDRIAWSQIGRGLTSLGFAITVLAVTGSVVLVAFAVAAAYGAWMIWDLVTARRVFAATAPVADRAALGRLLRQAAPLGLVTAIGSLQANVPRYFLEAHGTRVEVGVFSSLTQLLIVGGLIATAIANAASARLARHAAAGEWAAFTHTLRRLIGFGALLGAAGIATSATIGEPVLRLLYNDEFARHDDVLVWLAASSALLWTYMFLSTALDAMRQFRIQPWIATLSTAVITLASWQLVPRYGLRGASWAILAGFVVESILFVVAVGLPLRAATRSST